MNLRPRLHDVYIGRTVLLTVLATWAVLLGLDLVLALSGEFEQIGKGSYSMSHAVAWAAYTVPRRIVQIPALPRSLIGTVLRRHVKESLLHKGAGHEAGPTT